MYLVSYQFPRCLAMLPGFECGCVVQMHVHALDLFVF